MKPSDPFEEETLREMTEAYEYSGEGQFLGQKFDDLVNSVDNLRMELENISANTEENSIDGKRETSNQLFALRREVAAAISTLVFIGATAVLLLVLVLWRVW